MLGFKLKMCQNFGFKLKLCQTFSIFKEKIVKIITLLIMHAGSVFTAAYSYPRSQEMGM